MPMSITEVLTLINSEEFNEKVFWTGGTIRTDLSYYQKAYDELFEAYETLKGSTQLNNAINPHDISSAARVEYALGGLCSALARKQYSQQLYDDSTEVRNKALDAQNELFDKAAKYYEAAIPSTNPSPLPRFETNWFRFGIAEQLADVYELKGKSNKNLNFTNKAIEAFTLQEIALAKCLHYAPVFEQRKKKDLQGQIIMVKASIEVLGLEAKSETSSTLNSNERKTP